MELGNKYQRLGDMDKAIELYNGGVKLNPYYTKVYYYRGIRPLLNFWLKLVNNQEDIYLKE
ncbi:MAG: hypothetical protein Roseis2KO_08200 [Roseivirga sp.]